MNDDLKVRGWTVLPGVVPMELVERMRVEMMVAYDICRPIQVVNGVGDKTAWTVHHLAALPECPSFLEFLETNPAAPTISGFFDGNPYKLQSFGGAINTARSQSYAHGIHRDIRSFSPDKLMLNTLVMLDPFTDFNGSTLLLPGSHTREDKPSEEEFNAGAVRAIGPAGSILLFDSRVWHRGGNNETDTVRRSVTPEFCRAFYHQEFDYPRALGYWRTDLSPTLRQLLGYHSRTPSSLTEFYRTPNDRMYLPGQG